MDPKEKSPIPTPQGGRVAANPEMEEFFERFHEQMSHAKPGEAPIATAIQALKELSMESDAEESAQYVPAPSITAMGPTCSACGAHNREGNRFCSGCGVPLESIKTSNVQAPAGQHFYHHHYHHHYVSGNGASHTPISESRAPSSNASPKEIVRSRGPVGGQAFSRVETAVRQITQNWRLAANTKQLEDLLELYASDAVLLRPNIPAIRGAASIREFFVSALGAGLGEVEMEPIKVEILGDTAYEAGRCKMLVPSVGGKRREERGKYLLFIIKHSEGEWKIAADCWSSDLSLDK
jgi:uncharacterized protein (TIGR02246 family)